MAKMNFRVGQIVPSSNTTMETEVPGMLRAREAILPERFTFHSSRMRMKHVTADELKRMDGESDRCADELSDARVDVLGYACLVAIMSMGLGYHRASAQRLRARTRDNGGEAPVVTSAGALVGGLQALRVKKIALLAPYMPPLTKLVIDYIEAEGFEVVTHKTLSIPDNLAVGARDPRAPAELVGELDLGRAEAVVVSACVQMPSFASIALVEAKTGRPAVSAASCTVYEILRELGLRREVPGAGSLLSGQF